jgi:hypothetical protein
MIHFRFNGTKAVQAGAFILERNGDSMDKYLFIKMLYIADRESLKRWGEPITGDYPVSMEHGPVLSIIYDLTKGEALECRPSWTPFISDADKQTNQICLKTKAPRDHLSKNELTLLAETHEKFKGYSWKQMKDYCHKFPEYEEVGKGSKAIQFQAILSAVGKSPEQIREVELHSREMAFMDFLMEG